jgi:hypothetical protein
MNQYEYLKDRSDQFLALTGLNLDEFKTLVPYFQSAYEELYPLQLNWQGKIRQRGPGAGGKEDLLSFEEKLEFIFSYTKTYPLQAVQGSRYEHSQSWAHKWIHHLTPVLHLALAKSGVMPCRDGTELALSEGDEASSEYIIDGTARERERPQDKDEQKAHYNGKEHAHTDKNIVLVNAEDNWVTFLSETEAGSKHDKKMADEANITYPAESILMKDTGFQGYEPAEVCTYQPSKKPRGKPMPEETKESNRFISGIRVRVEHAIAGVKRCRIVKDVLRLKKAYFSDMVMAIACALHNFRTVFRNPFSMRTLAKI